MDKNVLIIENNIYSTKQMLMYISNHKNVCSLDYSNTFDNTINLLSTKKYDLVVFNILNINPKIVDVIKLCKQKNEKCKTLILQNNTTLQNLYEIYDIGVDIVLVRPITELTFCVVLDSLLCETAQETIKNPILAPNLSLKEKIDFIFEDLKVESSLKGYFILKRAIEILANDNSLKTNITKKLYPLLAKEFNTTKTVIEHQLRDYIEKIWKKGKLNQLGIVFNSKAFSSAQKPTNTEFISLIAEKIK